MIESQYPRRQRPIDPDTIYSHSRTRTTSSNVMTNQLQSPIPLHLAQPSGGIHNRRSPSVNTFSTISSSGMQPPAAYRTSPTTDLRRSTSSRSGGAVSIGAPSSYVALLRRQKATVWCDRAQYEDPRLLAQQRAAKMRATKEVIGAGSGYGPASGARTSTGISSAGGKVAAKIRHHGKANATGYIQESNYIGVGGVPLRLSATEVEGEDSEEEDPLATSKLHHRRTGSSGRSSTNSGRRGLSYRTTGAHGTTSSIDRNSRRWSPGNTPERSGSLVEQTERLSVRDDSASGRAPTVGSGSSAERADNVPDLNATSRLPPNSAMHAAITREKSVRNPEDLRRRGSVDERTMTLTAGRLFIANPD